MNQCYLDMINCRGDDDVDCKIVFYTFFFRVLFTMFSYGSILIYILIPSFFFITTIFFMYGAMLMVPGA